MVFHNPQETLGALAHAYYEERNTEAVLSCVTDDIEWVGTEHNDRAKGKAAFRALLKSDFAAFPDPFHVELAEATMQQLSADAVILTVTGTPHAALGTAVSSSIRGTVCCVKTERGWLVSHGHTSVPNAEIEKISLQNALQEERAKQKALLDNVPGGVAMYRLKKDGRISTDYVSDGLAKICGYDDSEDIMRVMGYDSRRLVLPEDFPTVAAACKKSLEQGVPTSVHYRVYGKDGTPVGITLDSIIMQNAALGEDDVAVFYAVQTLVSQEATKKAEKQEILLSLLNTVPAGIGIFDVSEAGISQNYLNDAFYSLIDTKREDRTQYHGQNTLATTHPKDVEAVKHAIKRLLDGDSSVQLDYRIKGGRGTWLWLHTAASVVQRKNGSIKIHAAFYECTESKLQQLQLLQNQKAVELAQRKGGLAIWTYHIDQGMIVQQTPIDGEGHMGYPVNITGVPTCFIQNNSIHPEDREKFLAVYQALEAGAEKVDELYRIIDRNTGAYDWVHMYYQRVENNDDRERVAVGFSLNVNKQQEAVERYRVEQKLREQMYASAAIYMEYNLTDHHYEGKNNLSNRYLDTQHWECPTIEKYRENMHSVADELYLDEIVEKMYAGNLLNAFENGETKVSCEYRSKERPEMPSTWYQITAVMVKRPDTGDVMAFVYVEDIEQKKVRQLAIESSMSDGIEIIAVIRLADGRAQIVQANSAGIPKGFREHFIYDDNFVDRSRRAVVPEEHEFSYTAALLSTVTKELEKQEIYQYSISMKWGDETVRRQLFRFRYLDDRKTNVVLSISDITSVYLEEQAKKTQLEAALCEAQKASQAKAEFYSRMSHDMRTPMNGILGMAELSNNETDSATLKENIRKIRESGSYLLSLINDTLDFQRIESGKLKLDPQIVSTAEIVQNIIDMIRQTAENKGVQLIVTNSNADLGWHVRIDPMRMKQIFVNLLSNAVKFTPSGGTVELGFQLLSRKGMISHDLVTVRDTGIGMSQDFLKHGIFKPFSQENNAVTSQYAGSGLGLSIAKSLVELMGGRIEVESELGVGTTFSVYIDFERVNTEDVRSAAKHSLAHGDAVRSNLVGKRILLVEDHPLNAEIAMRLLKQTGCEVDWLKNGADAVTCFEEPPSRVYDLVLMDIRMPIMDGLEAAKRIRSIGSAYTKTVPIIAMTANAYEEDIRHSIEAGMDAHLSKPLNCDLFFNTILNFIPHHRPEDRK